MSIVKPMDYHFQAAACCILLVILFDYSRNRPLPVRATRWFSVLLANSGFNLAADILFVFSLNHRDLLQPVQMTLIQRLFIGSFDTLLVTVFIYVAVMTNETRKNLKRRWGLRLIPAFVALLFVIAGPIVGPGRHEMPGRIASNKITAFIMYGIAVFYLVIIIIHTFVKGQHIDSKRKYGVRAGLLVWGAAVAIQQLFPLLLLSSFAQVLMVLFIYLSFENPKVYQDADAGTLNKKAFAAVITDRLSAQKKGSVLCLTLTNYTQIKSQFGSAEAHKAVKEAAETLASFTHEQVYRISDGAVCVLVSEKKWTVTLPQEMSATVQKKYEHDVRQYMLMPAVAVVEGIQTYKTAEQLINTLGYICGQHHDGAGVPVITFDEHLKAVKERSEKVEELLFSAVQNENFDVYYQPIYDTRARSFCSAEALVRLKDYGKLGFISPEEFIPLAEKRGLVQEIGRIVFTKVCACEKQNGLQQYGLHYIEVNLSGIQCMNPDLAHQYETIMKSYAVYPPFINLEITESAVISSGELLRENMDDLRKIGCTFSMDDFGTGYSNISQMLSIPYEIVKIDKSLLWPCFGTGDTAPAVQMLRRIVQLVHDSGYKAVVEGVETAEQAALLDSFGVEYHQGYLYSRPIPEAEFIAFLKEKNNYGRASAY